MRCPCACLLCLTTCRRCRYFLNAETINDAGKIALSVLIFLVIDCGVHANELYARSVGDLTVLLYDQSYTIRRLEAELEDLEDKEIPEE